MDITCGLMISQDRNLIRLFGAMPRIRTPPSTVTCIVLINLDNKIENFKIISNLKILRKKARYIENPKIMENSKNSINSGDIKDNKIYYNQNIYRNKLTNLNDNILEYNNMKNNINCNRYIQEINQNKLKKF